MTAILLFARNVSISIYSFFALSSSSSSSMRQIGFKHCHRWWIALKLPKLEANLCKFSFCEFHFFFRPLFCCRYLVHSIRRNFREHKNVSYFFLLLRKIVGEPLIVHHLIIFLISLIHTFEYCVLHITFQWMDLICLSLLLCVQHLSSRSSPASFNFIEERQQHYQIFISFRYRIECECDAVIPTIYLPQRVSYSLQFQYKWNAGARLSSHAKKISSLWNNILARTNIYIFKSKVIYPIFGNRKTIHFLVNAIDASHLLHWTLRWQMLKNRYEKKKEKRKWKLCVNRTKTMGWKWKRNI